MFKLDDDFLEDLGLGAMPEEQKKPFLQHIYQELELRVGTKLSAGMSDEQLVEFEAIIDKKDGAIEKWLESKVPDYKSDKLFKGLQDKSGLQDSDLTLLSEYAATKWLEINRPDYRDVVKNTLEELKKEITTSRDKILN